MTHAAWRNIQLTDGPVDGDSDGGDDGGNDGTGASVQDGSNDGDNANMGREGFFTEASWNPPAPCQCVQFSQEIANVRRALYLCDLPDTFHTPLIMVGGIKTIYDFLVISMAKWETMAKLMAKQKIPEGVQLIINTSNQ